MSTSVKALFGIMEPVENNPFNTAGARTVVPDIKALGNTRSGKMLENFISSGRVEGANGGSGIGKLIRRYPPVNAVVGAPNLAERNKPVEEVNKTEIKVDDPIAELKKKLGGRVKGFDPATFDKDRAAAIMKELKDNSRTIDNVVEELSQPKVESKDAGVVSPSGTSHA